jgi:hypothetical protein
MAMVVRAGNVAALVVEHDPRRQAALALERAPAGHL